MPQSNQKQQAPQPSRQSSQKQEYITAAEDGIYTPGITKGLHEPPYKNTNPPRFNLDMGRETRTIAGNAAAGVKYPDPIMRIEPNFRNRGGVTNKDYANALRAHYTTQNIVASRDAWNAEAMRKNLTNRAAESAVRSSVAAARRAAVGKGLMRAGGLAATAFLAGRNSEKGEADTGSYGTTALGGSNGSYAGQGKMSKALGVKNTKPGM